MILVTGSSGTVGRELWNELALAGETIRAGYRRPLRPRTSHLRRSRGQAVSRSGPDLFVCGCIGEQPPDVESLGIRPYSFRLALASPRRSVPTKLLAMPRFRASVRMPTIRSASVLRND
jgi:hypothetical protein